MNPATLHLLCRSRRALAALTAAGLLTAVLGAPPAQAACNAGSPVANLTETTPSGDFMEHGDGTVTHLATGLMWQRCAQGQSWNGSTCTGSAAAMNWATALAAPVGHSYAGHNDWRLPTMRELASIAEFCGHSPAINTSIFPNSSSYGFWTSSPYAPDMAHAWLVYFNVGSLNAIYKTNTYYARLVRGGQLIDSFDLLAPDTHPNAFSFTDQTGVANSSARTSNTITVSGINTAANISISGGEYQINGGVWTSSNGTVDNGNMVAVRHTSSASYNSTVDTTLTVDTVSDTFSSTTLSAPTAPGEPTSVMGTPGNAQIALTFVAPSPGTLAGGAAATITGYTADCGGTTQAGAGSPIVVTGLTNGTPYACTVTATNDVPLTGPAGTAASVTPATLPGAPTGVSATAGNAQATVSFAAPGNNGGAAIDNYRATCGSENNTGSASPLTVTGLPNGTPVTCTVVAHNSVGWGVESSASGSVTPSAPTAPGAPTSVVGTPGDAQISVAFVAPPPGTLAGGAAASITGYTATCGSQNNTGSSSPIVVAGLSNGTSYTCVVKATNNVPLDSPDSAASAAVTPQSLAAVPRAFVAAVSGDDANVVLNCPVAAPCRTFATALQVLLTGGEAVATESGDYGPVTVTRSATLVGAPGKLAEIYAASGNAVTLATAGIKVVLRGLRLTGVGADNGVLMSDGASLAIEHSVIEGFGQYGVSVTAAAKLHVSDSLLRGNAIAGVRLVDGAIGVINRSKLLGNAGGGVFVIASSSGAQTRAVVDRSVVSGGGGADTGIWAYSGHALAEAKVHVGRSSVTGGWRGIAAESSAGGVATATLSRTRVSGNTTGLVQAGPGALLRSRGNNSVSGNATNVSGAVTPLAAM